MLGRLINGSSYVGANYYLYTEVSRYANTLVQNTENS